MGRPRSEMDDATCEMIVRCVSLGFSPNRAAQAAGVKPSTMRSRIARDEGFASAVEKAGAGAEMDLLARIIGHSERAWVAAAWILERRWPERWARRDRDGQRPNATNDARALLSVVAEIKANAAGEAPRTENV